MSSPSQTKITRQEALDYHEKPFPGKIGIQITKPTATSRDLSLAYSPGVAEPCREINKDISTAFKYTNKRNLAAVISNGTAVLGLGNIGALASKPVMEGKSLLFKRYAGVDCFDIEVDTKDPEDFIKTVRNISVTFGAINLEDIKAPECFYIEETLKKQCDIPVFHDDQHGTAVAVAAGLINILEIINKTFGGIRVVCMGAGAAGIAVLRLLNSIGVPKSNIVLVDSRGVIHVDRDGFDKETPTKKEFASSGKARTLDEAMVEADVFIGLSGPDLLDPQLIKVMAKDPILFVCSNPDPEVNVEVALTMRDDLIIATGRSDYPNQINNVLGFPYIFRGALDVRASDITVGMITAAAKAIASVAKLPVTKEVLAAYGLDSLEYGRSYFIPKPVDSRLLGIVSAAVAQAAVDDGVAQLPYPSNYPLKSLDELM